MEALWIIYWGILICSIIFGIMTAIKYSKISGSVQLLLSLIRPCWAFIFALKRDYLSTGLESNELHFIYSKVMSGDMEAILLVSGFLVLIILAIYKFAYLESIITLLKHNFQYSYM